MSLDQGVSSPGDCLTYGLPWDVRPAPIPTRRGCALQHQPNEFPAFGLWFRSINKAAAPRPRTPDLVASIRGCAFRECAQVFQEAARHPIRVTEVVAENTAQCLDHRAGILAQRFQSVRRVETYPAVRVG